MARQATTAAKGLGDVPPQPKGWGIYKGLSWPPAEELAELHCSAKWQRSGGTPGTDRQRLENNSAGCFSLQPWECSQEAIKPSASSENQPQQGKRAGVMTASLLNTWPPNSLILKHNSLASH